MKIILAALSALCLMFVVAALSSASEGSEGKAPVPVSFVPQWLPQAQFAGYYVAHEKGFYRNNGLHVEILRGGPERESQVFLCAGKADFGTMFLASALRERAAGVPLVNIAQIVQKSSQVLVAGKTSGIHTPQDMNGKKVGLWRGELGIQPQVFFKKFGLQIIPVPQASTVNLFLRGGVHVASAMRYNEYHSILSAGFDPEELTVFDLKDHGVNFPEDGIYCTMETLRRYPGECRSFVRSSLEGWRYAFEHPEETLDIVMKHVKEANIATNRAHQRWMLRQLREVIPTGDPHHPMGVLRKGDYSAVALTLKAEGLVDVFPSYEDFFVNCTENQ